MRDVGGNDNRATALLADLACQLFGLICSRQLIATAAPDAARARQTAAPMPREPPVTSAVRPFRSSAMSGSP
ncbi:hypothetical protein ABIF63_001592 [Bradyrhizobium japonicum]|uniref:Uncharacterized protein n=1 Tax=Bradyrhizobium japonicum TaxID=375 RepID=A0ABV2RKL8_BRAJP